MGLEVYRKSDSAVYDQLVQELYRLMADLSIPHQLSAIGIKMNDLLEVAEVGAGNNGPNPSKALVEAMLALLGEAF